MGAEQFITYAKGKTAKEAFQTARDAAAWVHGHGGYTGTIAEKHTFEMVPVPAGEDPTAFVDRVMTEYVDSDEFAGAIQPKTPGFWDDKWGPAGCVKTGPDEYLFFGWASS